jgi:hypothetical protein
MPAAASLTFTPLTDPIVWFATVQAFNNFIGSITVSVASGNLPAATTLAIGGVKMAELATYTPVAVVPTWVTIISDEAADGTPESTLVPSQEAYNDLKTKLDNLATSYNNLLTALVAAGSLDLT